MRPVRVHDELVRAVLLVGLMRHDSEQVGHDLRVCRQDREFEEAGNLVVRDSAGHFGNF